MRKAHYTALVLCPLLFFSSCKKFIEDQQMALFISVLTSGQWHVENYIQGTVPITSEFEGYNFQFYKNGTVQSIYQSDTLTGSWVGDIQNYTIFSDFPSAQDPLKKLNGTWKITRKSTDYVEAEMKTVQEKMILHLRKN